MVDTPKEANDNDKEDPVEVKPPETQPRRWRQRCRSKLRHAKDSNTGTGENKTPDDAENNEDPAGAIAEQEEQENRQASPDEQPTDDNSEDDNYLPLSEDEVNLGDEDFIVPEEPLEQERFKRRLIATAKSLKKKQQ